MAASIDACAHPVTKRRVGGVGRLNRGEPPVARIIIALIITVRRDAEAALVRQPALRHPRRLRIAGRLGLQCIEARGRNVRIKAAVGMVRRETVDKDPEILMPEVLTV